MPDRIDIRRLSGKNLGDFLTFFDDRAFCDNPEWAECYCCFFYFPASRWEKRTGDQNRESAEEFVKDGRMNGYMAYRRGTVVGWVNADRIDNYPRILQDPDIGQDGGKGAAVVCFVTDPEYRRKGIAAALLDRLILDFTEDGYDYIEAYPRRTQKGDAQNYHGPVAMYKSAGFKLHAEKKDIFIYRKYLK